jgi:Tfp pilus assembly protein PilF
VKTSRPLQIALACGLSCGIMGCKSPMSPTNWFARSPAQSTAPDVQYNGMAEGYSATVKSNANTAVVSGAKPEGAMTKAWNSTTGAVASVFGTAPKPSKDATALNNKPGKLDADIYIRAAGFAEQSGNFAEAEGKYQQALKVEPRNVIAILGLARLYDKQENSQAAVATYQQAIKLHPKAATVYNDFGLCYGRRREFAPAQQMLQKAVELEPGKANYRNNLAAVLVDMGRPQEALQQLLAVQEEGVAHYNMAYLLSSRGQQGPAIAHLQQAIAKDPTLTPARELLAQLDGSGTAETLAHPGESPRPHVQMASSTRPSRPGGRILPGNQRQQTNQEDLQPPEINYGPVGNEGTYRLQSYDAAPDSRTPTYPHTRTAHVAEIAPEIEADPSPTTIRITDDEE